MTRLLIIANLRGRRRARRFAAVRERLEWLGASVEVRHVQVPGDAALFAREAAEAWKADQPNAPGRLVIAGGDGTFNDAVNGLAGASLPIAFLPLGTANVLAYELDLPTGAEALARVIIQGPPVPASLGLVNGRLFLLMAGIGIDAEVCERINRRTKALLRKGAYVQVTIERWVRYFPRRYRIEIDGVVHYAASAVVTNARHYAGPFEIASEADLSTSVLHVCLYLTPGRLAVVRYGLGMLTGRLSRMSDYRVVEGRHVVIRADDDVPVTDPVQVDGDVMTYLPAEITLAEHQVMLVRR